MGVVKTGNNSASFKVDDPGLRAALELRGVIDAGKFFSDDHDLVGLGMPGIERRDSSVFEDKISDWFHESYRDRSQSMRQFLRHDLRFERGLWSVVNHRISVFDPYPVGA